MNKNNWNRPQKAAQDILKQFDITDAPIPVDRIAKLLGATVKFSPLDDELSGMIFIDGELPIIGVNALHHPNRQRFTIAHELGHLVLHRDLLSTQVHVDKQFKVLMRDAKAASGTNKIEIEANRFAAELLIPTSLITQMINEQFDIEDDSLFDDLAKQFKVSKQMLEHRIRNLFV